MEYNKENNKPTKITMLKLPVLWIEDSDIPLQELGIDIEPVLKDVCFFTIDHLYEVENGVVIVSSGIEYQSPVEFNELIELLCQER